MPDVRELLHDVAPAVSRDLDLEAVHNRARQRTRRKRAVGAGIAALLVVTITVTVAATAGGNDRARRVDVIDDRAVTTPERTAPALTTADPAAVDEEQVAAVAYTLPPDVVASAVITDGDLIFVGGLDDRGYAVWGLDRDTGDVLARTALPGAVRGMASGASVVWVWGGGDGGEPVGGVAAVDRRDLRVVGTFGWDHEAPEAEWHSTYDLAANGETAYVSDATHDRVYALSIRYEGDRRLDGLDVAPIDVGDQPTDVVWLTDGSVWVQEAIDGTIARIDVRSLEVTARQPWANGRLVSASGNLIWAYMSPQLVELDPSLLTDGISVSLGTRLSGLGRVFDVLRGPTGTWIVAEHAISHFERVGNREPVLRARLYTRGTVPSATVDGNRLLFVTGGNNLIEAWTPTY